MNVIGWLLIIAGSLALLLAAMMDTTVGGSFGAERVHNLGLLVQQLLLGLAGSAAFAAGSVVVAIDALRQSLVGRQAPDAQARDLDRAAEPPESPSRASAGPSVPCASCGTPVTEVERSTFKGRTLCSSCFQKSIS